MADNVPADRVRPSKLFWVIGVVALVWNSFGALDYTMTETRNAAWLGQFTAEQLAYIQSVPAWSIAGWALGVWGGVAGSLLLLLHKRLAAPVYLVSLVGAIVSHIHYLFLSNGREVLGGGVGSVIWPVIIVAIAVGLWLYARAQAQRGVLG